MAILNAENFNFEFDSPVLVIGAGACGCRLKQGSSMILKYSHKTLSPKPMVIRPMNRLWWLQKILVR